MNRWLGVNAGDANVLTKNNLIHTKCACVHFSESGFAPCHITISLVLFYGITSRQGGKQFYNFDENELNWHNSRHKVRFSPSM